MQKKIGIVTMMLDSWELSEIYKEINKQGYEYEIINNNNAIIDFDKLVNKESEYKAILGRVERPILKEGLILLKVLELKGEKIFNNADAIQNGQNKAYCSAYLTAAKVPHPKTIFGFSAKEIKEEIRKLHFPIVIKPWIGGRGVGIVKVDNIDIANDFIDFGESSAQPFYIQEFVHAKEIKEYQDIRVFIVGDEVIGAFYREAIKGEWKTNICNGGIAKKYKLTLEVEEIAMKAMKAINADIAGVDVINSDVGYQVLEVNVCPLFGGFYNITGINPAEAIAALLCSNK